MNVRSNTLSIIFATFVGLLCTPGAPIQAQPQAGGIPSPTQGMQYAVNPEAMNSPEFQQMVKEAENFLSNLSEEEMEDFMSFYGDFLQAVEKGDIDLAELLPEGVLQEVSTEPTEPAVPVPPITPTAPEEDELPAISPSDQTKVEQTIRLITQLIERLEAVDSKVHADERARKRLENLQSDLDLLLAYLHVLKKKKHVRQMILDLHDEEKKEEDTTQRLLDTLTTLKKELDTHEPRFVVTPFGAEKLPTADQQVSDKAFDAIVRAIQQAFDLHVIADAEALIKKYEPEALKKVQAHTEAEKRAQVPGATTPRTSYYDPGYAQEQRYTGTGYDPYAGHDDYDSGYGGRSYGRDYDYPSYGNDYGDYGDYGAGTPGETAAKPAENGKPAEDKDKKPTKAAKPEKTSETRRLARRIEAIAGLLDDAEDAVSDDMVYPGAQVTAYAEAERQALQNITNNLLPPISKELRMLRSGLKRADATTRTYYDQEIKKIFQTDRPQLRKLYAILKNAQTTQKPAALGDQATAIQEFIDQYEYIFLGKGTARVPVEEPVVAEKREAATPSQERVTIDPQAQAIAKLLQQLNTNAQNELARLLPPATLMEGRRREVQQLVTQMEDAQTQLEALSEQQRGQVNQLVPGGIASFKTFRGALRTKLATQLGGAGGPTAGPKAEEVD